MMMTTTEMTSRLGYIADGFRLHHHALAWRFVFVVTALTLAAVASSTGALRTLNEAIVDLRFQLSPKQAVTQSVVIAIDTKSLQAHRDWPWPRDRYAELIERLNEAGARHIAFDIDFSSPREGDKTFAAAIARSQAPVYLPAFRQAFDAAPDLIAEIRPNPVVAQNAKIATTMFPAESDGMVRRLPSGAAFSDAFVPQLAYALAERDAPHGEPRINPAIDIAQTPIISFTDVISGAPIDDIVSDRTVFVGATATELGDEFVLPSLGLQSGVLLNALAYETVRSQTERRDAPRTINLLFVLIASIAAMAPLARLRTWLYSTLNIGVFAAIALTGYGAQAGVGLVIFMGEAHIAHLAGVLLLYAAATDRAAAESFRSQMDIESRAKVLDAIMSSNHDGIITVAHTGRVESCNERAAELLGRQHHEIVSTLFTDVIPDLGPTSVTGGCRERASLTSPNGETRFVHMSCVEVITPPKRSRYERRHETRRKLVYTLHDVTDQARTEQAEREAKEMHARASQAKTALLNNMSHELRTPLNAIIGFADIIASTPHHAPDKQVEYGTCIRSSGKQLLNIVNDMMLAARFQSQDVTPSTRWIDADELAESALVHAQAQSSWTAPTVDMDVEEAELEIDVDLAMVALRHLIDNAAKFAGPNGHVVITGATQGEHIQFAIEDDGPGMAEEALSALTEAFTQADASISRTHGGCGLGLYLASSIASALGGELHLESKTNGGLRAQIAFHLEGIDHKGREDRLVA